MRLFFAVCISLLVGVQIGIRHERKLLDRDRFELQCLRAEVMRLTDRAAWQSAAKVSKLTGTSFFQVLTGIKE